MVSNRMVELNGLSLELASLPEADNFDLYIKDYVMKMQKEAVGLVYIILPIILRVDIEIINLEVPHSTKGKIKIHRELFES